MSSPIKPKHRQLLVDHVYSVQRGLDESIKKVLRLSRALAPATDDEPVNTTQLAASMKVHRSTVSEWKREGYVFEFGTRTTVAHCKDWLRSRQGPSTDNERVRRAELVRSLR